MKRRDFIANSAAGLSAFGLAGVFGPRLAWAAEDKDHYFIFCYFEGGWDQLLALDPRDPGVFTEADVYDTGIQPAYHLLQSGSQKLVDAGAFKLGPCAVELAGLTDHFSVVRGINMGTLTHEVGRRYFITGRPPSGLKARGSSVATLATHQLGGGLPVPHLAHAVESYAVDMPAYAAAMPVAAVGHMRYILRENLGIPTSIRQSVKDALHDFWQRKSTADGAAQSKLADIYRSNRARSAELVKSDLYQAFELDSPGTAEVRAHYGFTPMTLETPAGRAALAAQALKSGLSRVVSVTLGGQLDTHGNEWARDQPQRLRDGMTALARLLEDLRDSEAPTGGSLLSKTTLVAFSEFGRTAKLNERQGRDHSLTNSALIAGAGITPGLVIGSSSDKGMGPNLIDLSSGTSTESGQSLKPEHVMTTALHTAGLDASELRSEPIEALLASG